MSDGPDDPPTMPFGKYKGKFITDVPDDYLQWLEPQEFVYTQLRETIRTELEGRGLSSEDSPWSTAATKPFKLNRRDPCPDPALARELIEAGVRTLSIRLRPDEGKLTTLDKCANWLRQKI